MTEKPTTQNGTVLELRPVSNFLVTNVRNQARAKFIEKHQEIPEPPTYDIECGGGPFGSWIETRTHTTDTITDGTEDEKATWSLYLELQNELNNLEWEHTSRLYFLEGMQNPPENGWTEKQTRYGIDIPDDPDERKMHWIKTEVIVSRAELSWLARLIQGQSNFTEVGRRLAADMFRRAMEQIERINALGNQEEII